MAQGETYGSTDTDPSLGEAPSGDTLGTTGGGKTYGSSGMTDAEAQAAEAGAGQPVSTKGDKLGLYGGGGTKGAQNIISVGTAQTGAQQLQELLAPYIKELTQLGPEYQKEMNFLAPYLAPAHAENFSDIVSQSKADNPVQGQGSSAVNAADTAVGEAMINQQAPGFGNEATAGKQAAAAAPYQEPIQAGLAYQKYLQTYGGLPANTQGWNPQAAAAYQEVMGGTTSGGLPSITNAAAANQANTNLTTTANQVTQANG